MKNIHAFTETDIGEVYLRGFISINVEDNGKTYASVRTRDTGEMAKVEMSKEQLVSLARGIFTFYNVPETGI